MSSLSLAPAVQPLQPFAPHALREAILRAAAYADVFDFPLTLLELQRYLVGVPASTGETAAGLAGELGPGGRLNLVDGLVCLRGREGLASLRRERARRSTRAWPRALHYGRALAGLPFVRMVALTGSLAAGNLEAGGDLDYLVVTTPNRLWLCRALIVALVRWASLRGERLCPNYFLDEQSLRTGPEDLYQAHELAQMVPLSGLQVYYRMRRENAWALRFLPNASGPPALTPGREISSTNRWKGALEKALGGGLGARLDAWEMRRKIRRLEARAGRGPEAVFCAGQCKGHLEGHAGRTLSAFYARLERLGLDPGTVG